MPIKVVFCRDDDFPMSWRGWGSWMRKILLDLEIHKLCPELEPPRLPISDAKNREWWVWDRIDEFCPDVLDHQEQEKIWSRVL